MLGSGIAMWQICCRIVVSSSVGRGWWCPLVVLYSMSVAGVRVVEFGPNAARYSCLTEKTLEKSMVSVEFPSQTYEMPAVGQWLVVQQRLDTSTDFYRQWISYKEGLKPPQQKRAGSVLVTHFI